MGERDGPMDAQGDGRMDDGMMKAGWVGGWTADLMDGWVE